MKWQNCDLEISTIDSYFGKSKILKNDQNLKPDWVQHPAENTEFHIVREKEEILIVVGESWTYGESLPNIATGIQQYSLESQIRHCFGPRLALALDADYYQYAVPGNCNYYMISSIPRILDHLRTNYKYKKIRLCVQLTEPSRELAIIDKLKNTFAEKIYDMSSIKTFDDWLVRYDEIFLDRLSEIQNSEIIVWKNFCPFQNKKSYLNLKLIKETWIQMSGKLYAQDLGYQRFQSIGWFDDFYNRYKHALEFNIESINKEIDNIEKSNNFINGNYIHNNHPNLISHMLWTYKLLNEI